LRNRIFGASGVCGGEKVGTLMRRIQAILQTDRQMGKGDSAA
jgi:hypothetical protein